MLGPAGTLARKPGFKRNGLRFLVLPPGGFECVCGEHFHIKEPPGCGAKSHVFQWWLEVRGWADGYVSPLASSWQENKPGGAEFIRLVTPTSDLTAPTSLGRDRAKPKPLLPSGLIDDQAILTSYQPTKDVLGRGSGFCRWWLIKPLLTPRRPN